MGVHGLTTYVEHVNKTKHYAERIVVRGGPVVIDGSNLMYHLYFAGRSPVVDKKGQGNSVPKKTQLAYLVGGDWMLYAQNVRYFFQQLKHCEITPIVIFDGAYEKDKLKVAFKRFWQNVRDNVNETDGGMPGSSYTPLQMKSVFLEILDEQKIPHYQTSFEADQTIAFVAKLLARCPILSEDSDFYIYADAMAVPLKSLKFKLKQQGKDKKHLKGKVEESKEKATEKEPAKKVWTLEGTRIPIMKIMKKEFNIDNQEVLALAALLIGNDNPYTGNLLITRQGVPLSRSVEGAFRFLGNNQTVEEIIKKILNPVPMSEKAVVAKQLLDNLAVYKGEVGDSDLWDLIKSETDVSQWVDESVEKTLPAKDSLTEILEKFDAIVTMSNHENQMPNCDADKVFRDSRTKNENIPKWYLRKHYKCQFQTYLRNIQENQVVFLRPQVEIRSKDPCHHLSLPIIRVTSGILLGDESKPVTVATHMSGKPINMEVIPLTDLPRFGKLPALADHFESGSKGDFGSIAHETRLKIMLTTLGIFEKGDAVFYEGWPPSYRIWIATLMFFIKQSEKEIGSLEEDEKYKMNTVRICAISSIFLCVIKSLLTDPGSPSTAHERNPALRCLHKIHQLQNETPEYLASIRGFYHKFENVSEAKASGLVKTYDIECARFLCQFMCLMNHVDMLNSLLFNPLKQPKFRYMINNYFIYNFAHYLNQQLSTVRKNGTSPSEIIKDDTGVAEVGVLMDNLLHVFYKSEDYVDSIETH